MARFINIIHPHPDTAILLKLSLLTRSGVYCVDGTELLIGWFKNLSVSISLIFIL